ncbi:MAG: hypothetical protein AAF065_11850 [Verrucomicrobiota bacterium]
MRKKCSNAAKAVARQVTAAAKGDGLKVSSQESSRRLKICQLCKYWNESGNIGLGECRKCGCTRIKQRLATEGCPINKWH